MGVYSGAVFCLQTGRVTSGGTQWRGVFQILETKISTARRLTPFDCEGFFCEEKFEWNFYQGNVWLIIGHSVNSVCCWETGAVFKNDSTAKLLLKQHCTIFSKITLWDSEVGWLILKQHCTTFSKIILWDSEVGWQHMSRPNKGTSTKIQKSNKIDPWNIKLTNTQNMKIWY